MKKLILTCGALLFCFGTLFAQNNMRELPETTQEFVKKHFPNEKIKSAEREKDLMNFGNGEMYEVELENGIKMDFNEAGDLTEIESNDGVAIPKEALPETIYSYVEKNYPDAKIVNWEADTNDQEVELSDGTDLEFDTNGKFMKVD
ncbi:MAG TPA: PepSY-like domain-containing protein [Flavobacteriaceae bacterium]|nr:PepSY-like domain-containing protein [Flavobacteriaceae bacterium]